MNKTVLKDFAIESRKDLMDRIKIKLNLFYLNESFTSEQNGDLYILSNDSHTLTLTKEEYQKRNLLLKRIKEIGIENVIEEASYTWFNRLIAIRYMEIHDYLPLGYNNESLGIRVLSSNDNTPNPEILKFNNLINNQLDLSFDKNYFTRLNNDNEKFKYVLQLVCNKMKRVFPLVFDGVTDYIDLLIPENMLSETGIVTKLINKIDENDFNNVEIIGWLYQYYNQTEKDRVMSENRAYKKNEIAYVTQLFTPEWIVNYLVQNTVLNYCDVDTDLKEKYIYFDKNSKLKNLKKDISKVKFIDPCCGSGHILVSAFEIIYDIYLSLGYNKRDIAKLIIENNLYGLDLDDRAGQLSVLSLLLKAREYDKDIFNKINHINVMSIQESNDIDYSLIENIDDDDAKKEAIYLFDTFKNAKEIGSLLKVEYRDYNNLKNYFSKNNNIFSNELHEKIKPLINIAEILSAKYDIYVTNPPYMNNDGMSTNIKEYLKIHYPDSKTDLYASFMDVSLLNEDGIMGMINQHGWMFLSSFEKIRNKILNNKFIASMCHLGPRAFEEIGGEVVQTTAFILSSNECVSGSYYRLNDISNPGLKEKKYLDSVTSRDLHYDCNKENFLNIPGSPVAYWVDKKIYEIFKNNPPLGSLVDMFQGIITGNNNKFLRLWWEVDNSKIAFDKANFDFEVEKQYWIPYNKGGSFRKWYGNQEYVVNWKNGPDDKTRGKASFSKFYLNEYVSWSYITTSTLATRYFPKGFLWDVAGSGIFVKGKNLKYFQAIIGSKIGVEILKIINPTMNYQVENVALLPIVDASEEVKDKIITLIDECINISKRDWDSNETSWNFDGLNYIENNKLIKDCIDEYTKRAEYNKNILRENEIKINEIVSNLYDYKVTNNDNDEVTYSVLSEEILIKKLIQYSVGCMFGRFDFPGFEKDSDSIIPISDSNDIYYSDDIVDRFKEFIKIAYGEDYLEKNLEYISDILGRKGTETAIERIRKYFINEFYLDHTRYYQKKPIYWLLDSGTNNGFKCLIYLHNYNSSLMSKIRVDYLHKVQNNYSKKIEELSAINNGGKNFESEISKLNLKINECNIFDEKLGHIANKMIDIDLDDGIKVNYEKFADILAKIK